MIVVRIYMCVVTAELWYSKDLSSILLGRYKIFKTVDAARVSTMSI